MQAEGYMWISAYHNIIHTDYRKCTVKTLIRLLSLFVYIMNKTGTAVNKVKTLLKS